MALRAESRVLTEFDIFFNVLCSKKSNDGTFRTFAMVNAEMATQMYTRFSAPKYNFLEYYVVAPIATRMYVCEVDVYMQ